MLKRERGRAVFLTPLFQIIYLSRLTQSDSILIGSNYRPSSSVCLGIPVIKDENGGKMKTIPIRSEREASVRQTRLCIQSPVIIIRK